MEILSNAGDLIELLIYLAVFIGITLYSAFKSKNKKQNQNNDDVVQGSNQDNTTMHTGWKGNRKKTYSYQISRNKTNNPIFGNSTTNISYTRTFIIFLAVAVFAVLLIAYFTGAYEAM